MAPRKHPGVELGSLEKGAKGGWGWRMRDGTFGRGVARRPEGSFLPSSVRKMRAIGHGLRLACAVHLVCDGGCAKCEGVQDVRHDLQ